MGKAQRSKWQIHISFIGAVVICCLDVVVTILQKKITHQPILIPKFELIHLLVKDSILGFCVGYGWSYNLLYLPSKQRLKEIGKIALTMATVCIWCVAFYWFQIYIWPEPPKNSTFADLIWCLSPITCIVIGLILFYRFRDRPKAKR